MTSAFPPLANLKAVTFDVGGTMIRPWPSVGHIYSEVAGRHGLGHLTAASLEERFRSVWARQPQLAETRSGWEQLVDEAFADLAPSSPSRTFFAELYDRFAAPEAWRIFDDVPPVLERLAADGFRLAVVSNWDDRLRGLLARLGLDSRFETIVVSCEVGCRKPDRGIFDAAARRLGFPAGQILHIGDSVEMDLLGARNAGFQALQIDRGATSASPDLLQSMLDLFDRLPA